MLGAATCVSRVLREPQPPSGQNGGCWVRACERRWWVWWRSTAFYSGGAEVSGRIGADPEAQVGDRKKAGRGMTTRWRENWPFGDGERGAGRREIWIWGLVNCGPRRGDGGQWPRTRPRRRAHFKWNRCRGPERGLANGK
uniref:Uncharacterized protein n=2 Tax=Aegilops tauschii subsp. strangulata TaxID=200361 RepID=A0A453PHG4_AEGTS